MNERLIIDKQGSEWIAKLIEYDPLPFGNYKPSVVDEFKCNSFSELMQEVGNRNYIDKINKND